MALGGGLSIYERVEFLCEIEVQIGQATFAVRAEDEAHFAVADVYIRVVICLLGQLCYAIHEINGLLKIIELKRALDCFAFHFPQREFLDGFFDFFCVVNSWHGVEEILFRGEIAGGEKDATAFF